MSLSDPVIIKNNISKASGSDKGTVLLEGSVL